MALELFDFQRTDVDRFKKENHKAGLFAYDMALGKTLTATTLAVELGTKVNLIIAPQVTFDGWEAAVHTQTEGQHQLKWMKRGTKQGEKNIIDFYDGVPGWYFVTWQLMRGGALLDTETDMLIADEVHEIQNKGGSAQNILINKIKAQYKVGLSGTPAGNKMQGLFGITSWLWPKQFKSYWGWLKDNFLLAGSAYQLEPIREKRPGLVVSQLPFYVRRLKADHYSDMIPTPLPLVEVFVDLTPRQREVYDTFKEKSGVWTDENEGAAGFLYAKDSIVKVGRLREIAIAEPVMTYDADTDKYTTTFKPDTKSAKIDKVIEIIESRPGKPFVVYTHSKKVIPALVQRLADRGIKAEGFTGDLNYKQKRAMIKNLGETYQVMIATQASVGTGTDGLQHKSSKLIWLSRDVKSSVNTQARDRLYRPGQTEEIEQWEIIARDTNDRDTNDHLDLQEEQVNSMLNATKIEL